MNCVKMYFLDLYAGVQTKQLQLLAIPVLTLCIFNDIYVYGQDKYEVLPYLGATPLCLNSEMIKS